MHLLLAAVLSMLLKEQVLQVVRQSLLQGDAFRHALKRSEAGCIALHSQRDDGCGDDDGGFLSSCGSCDLVQEVHAP